MKQIFIIIGVLLTLNSFSQSIPTNGLVAWYPFSGNTNDSSGNGNNGTNYGATLTTDRFGRANSAYSFNGSSVITIPNSTSLQVDSSMTISLWCKYFNLGNGLNSILQKGTGGGCKTTGYYVAFDNGGLGGKSYDKTLNYTHTVGQNQICDGFGDGTNLDSSWHYLTFVYNPKVSNVIYFDGKKMATNWSPSDTFSISNTSNPLLIGGNLSYLGNNVYYLWNGKLDDMRFYNRALDSTEINALYHEGGYSLPVTIDNINASQKGNLVSVDWRTATEVNTGNFNIQHSNNGEKFTDIGTVKAIGIGGNSYEFTDKAPTNGINYYRLQNLDKDGSSSYSKVVSVTFGDKQSFSIIPNPAKDFATISFSKAVDKAIIAVYDITGKTVITQSVSGINAYKLNTQTLTNGVYVIKVNTVTGSFNEKLLINK